MFFRYILDLSKQHSGAARVHRQRPEQRERVRVRETERACVTHEKIRQLSLTWLKCACQLYRSSSALLCESRLLGPCPREPPIEFSVNNELVPDSLAFSSVLPRASHDCQSNKKQVSRPEQTCLVLSFERPKLLLGPLRCCPKTATQTNGKSCIQTLLNARTQPGLATG